MNEHTNMIEPNAAPKMFGIPQPLLQNVADYLSTRPYREVATLLHAMQTCQPVEDMRDGNKA